MIHTRWRGKFEWMKKICSLFGIMFISPQAFSQPPYKQALGLQAPFGVAGIYSNFVTDKNSVQLQAGAGRDYYRVAGHYVFHFFSFEKTPEINWYAGPGIQAIWNKEISGKTESAGLGFGLSGILGVEYCFASLPLSAGVNWQPGITIIGKPGVQSAFGGITLRYLIKR